MTEPSAIWSSKLIVFDKSVSLTQNVILSHGRFALQALVSRIDRLYELIGALPNLIDFYPHPDIPATLTDIAFQHGLASTILFNDSPKGKSESAAEYKCRAERVTYVKAGCAHVLVDVLADRKIRNSLTHIDEHLVKHLSQPNTGWYIDSAIGRRDQFTAPNGLNIGFCRTYIASEDVLLHLGNEISIKRLRRQAKRVLSAIWKEPI